MAFKMYGKSPMMKKLVGKQNNLPQELKDKIEASPAKMKKDPAMKMAKDPAMKMKKSPMKQNTVENFMKVANKVTRAKGGKVSYKSAWQAMDSKAKAKYASFDAFKAAAKDFNTKNPNYDKSKYNTRKNKGGQNSIL